MSGEPSYYDNEDHEYPRRGDKYWHYLYGCGIVDHVSHENVYVEFYRFDLAHDNMREFEMEEAYWTDRFGGTWMVELEPLPHLASAV